MHYVTGYRVSTGPAESEAAALETAPRLVALGPVCFPVESSDHLFDQLPELVPEPLLKAWARVYLRRALEVGTVAITLEEE